MSGMFNISPPDIFASTIRRPNPPRFFKLHLHVPEVSGIFGGWVGGYKGKDGGIKSLLALPEPPTPEEEEKLIDMLKRMDCCTGETGTNPLELIVEDVEEMKDEYPSLRGFFKTENKVIVITEDVEILTVEEKEKRYKTDGDLIWDVLDTRTEEEKAKAIEMAMKGAATIFVGLVLAEVLAMSVPFVASGAVGLALKGAKFAWMHKNVTAAVASVASSIAVWRVWSSKDAH